MRAVSAPELIVDWEQLEIDAENISMSARVTIKLNKPEQNEELLHVLAEYCEESGQQLKRVMYKQAVELADYELVLSIREGKEGKGIQRIGKRRYTIKTVFGTVKVYRIRIRHKANNVTEIPSAKAWGTPRQITISRGLKSAIYETASKESYGNTVKQMERRSGEKHLISKSSIKNIMHAVGQDLAKANEERAAAIYEADEQARKLLGRAEAHLAEEYFERLWIGCDDLDEELSELDEEEREHHLRVLCEQIAWDARTEPAEPAETSDSDTIVVPATIPTADTASSAIRSSAGVDEHLIIIEPDEVVIRSQQEGQFWLTHYNAVVIAAEKSYYFTASTSSQLLYQVSSLLATLTIDTNKRLLLISDGAAWIRRWYESIGIRAEEKMSVLCWFHLKKHCWRLIREAISNKEDRLTVRKVLFRYLWRGQVTAARAYLTEIMNNVEDGFSTIAVSDIKALTALKEYLLMREQHIVDYQARMRAGKWIANTKIEKFNDWSVSSRCKKKNGMKWTSKGVAAIAALETARRNGELVLWQQQRKLPGWRVAA